MRLALAVVLGAAVSVLAGASLLRAAETGPRFAWPLACEVGRTCEVQNYVDRDPGPGVLDYRCGHRTYDGHTGVDIRLLNMAAQRTGVDVLAAAAGRVARLRDGVQDISIRAPGAPSVKGQECGNAVVVDHGDGWETQYCHLARGSVRVKTGDMVAAGQPIARVGLSGDTEFPHLHFWVRRNGQTIDPFAPDAVSPGACGGQPTLWNAGLAGAVAYKRGAVLNTGFATGLSTLEAVEAGAVPPPTAEAPALVGYVRLIGLEAGDVIRLRLLAPDGAVLVDSVQEPLDHDKAQWLSQAGRKRPLLGWPHGPYTAEVTVRRNDVTAIEGRWRVTL